MNLNDLFNEEKVRLDPHCWHNKKIGKPKTKVKGGVRVNNCVPKESVSEAPLPGQRRDPLDLQPLEGGSVGGGSLGSGIGPRPVEPLPKWTPSRIPGVDVHTGPPPVVTKPSNINSKIDAAADVPAYVRKGLPDPVTVPKPGTKPKITVRPGETVPQAMQRTKDEQEFNKFLQGQSGQSFGPSTAAPTSGANQVPTVKLPGGQTIPDPARLSPSGQYNPQSKSNPEMDKIMKTWDQQQLARQSGSKDASQSGSKDAKPLNKVSQWLLGIDEETSRKKRKEPEVDYDAIDHDKSVERLRHLAGLGPMKTVWDPARRVYKNVPTADQPHKK